MNEQPQPESIDFPKCRGYPLDHGAVAFKRTNGLRYPESKRGSSVWFPLVRKSMSEPAMVKTSTILTEEQLGGAPLVIDIDGTLIRSDLLVESLLGYLGDHPMEIIWLARALTGGKATFKAHIASKKTIDPSDLPYDERLLSLIAQSKARGGKVYLASASNEVYVAAIADYIGADGWINNRLCYPSQTHQINSTQDLIGEASDRSDSSSANR